MFSEPNNAIDESDDVPAPVTSNLTWISILNIVTRSIIYLTYHLLILIIHLGSLFWCKIIDLFKNRRQQQQQDVSILVDAMTLVNKTLAGIPDQDTFYDFVDALEELGMESIVDKYSNLDAQLKEQFRLYEKALEAEDNDDDEERETSNNNNSKMEVEDLEEKRRVSRRAQLHRLQTRMSQSNVVATAVVGKQPRHAEEVDEVDIGPAEVDELVVVAGVSPRNEFRCGQQQVGEDQYESANESASDTTATTNRARQQVVDAATTTNDSSHRQTNEGSSEARQNLARGKQQRASISSCSSSDSYASYGSGYASGSGNSTDHEHKQKGLAAKLTANSREPKSGVVTGEGSSHSASNDKNKPPGAEQHEAATTTQDSKNKAIHDNNDDDQVGNEEGDEEDSKLRQHLSELEQLTDELASRKIFCTTITQPSQSTSKHFSATIKSTSSNASSVLSTGSNISSSSSSANNNNEHSQQVVDSMGATITASQQARISPSNNDSRSTSATPTLCGQQQKSQYTNSLQPLSSSLRSANVSANQMGNGSGMAFQKQQAAAISPTKSNATPPASYQYPLTSSPKQQQQLHSAQKLSSTANSSSPLSSGATPAAPSATAASTSKQEPYYHNLFQWEQLFSKGVTRPLLINDLDFTDLIEEDDCDLLNSSNNNSANQSRATARNQATGEPLTISIPASGKLGSDHESGVSSGASTGSPNVDGGSTGTPVSAPPPLPPPPMSPWFNTISASSRPQSQFISSPSPTFEFGAAQQASGEFNRDQSPANSTYSNYSRNSVHVPQANASLSSQLQFNTLQPVSGMRAASSMSSLLFGNNGKFSNKRKKTMKLFWKEVREDRSLLSKLTKKKTIWDEIKPVQLDTSKLEYLFESKAKDLMLSKSRNGLDGSNQKKVKITVLDAKRSNAINIGMTKLPPMRTIKSAILKMDSSIMNREGIEKILTTMMPTEEEKSRIIEAQLANPDTPLGTAEQFLLNLASISALEARLKLWAFQLDYAQIEKEVAEPLMDLKQAIEEIERSETFRIILGTLLAVGNFLNSTNAKGFQIDYLEKVPEVKDTVNKHSLLHHLCLFIQEKYDPQLTSDLYSEFSAVNRGSKVDYSEVAKSLKKMQQDCKASWDYLKIVAKHDGLANLMNTCSSSVNANTCTSLNDSSSSTSSSNNGNVSGGSGPPHQQPKTTGKLNNLSKLSMITTIMGPDGGSGSGSQDQTSQQPTNKQLKTKVSDFLTDCAERIMVLMVIHRRVMNRFQKLLVYLGCPSHQIKQTQPQQFLKVINEFALEYRTKRERVREMLAKKQQCPHHGSNNNLNHSLSHHQHQTTPNRTWQLNRTRWSGSQACIDQLGYPQRPCSTTSSCASPFLGGGNYTNGCSDCAREQQQLQQQQHQQQQQQPGNSRHRSVEPSSMHNTSGNGLNSSPRHHLNQSHNSSGISGHHANSHHQSSHNDRPGSPSGYSQISNYSDYLFDQSSCCNSRQESITPVPLADKVNGTTGNAIKRRPHSMSISMFDLQNQQSGSPSTSMRSNASGRAAEANKQEVARNMEHQQAREKDEQLRRLLGAGKSLDGACNDLYQMSHWSTTTTRVTRHPPLSGSKQQQQHRAVSMESSGRDDDLDDAAQQSSYYKHLNETSGRQSFDGGDDLPNSDEEILQSLVRTSANKGGQHNVSFASSNGNNNSRLSTGSGANRITRRYDMQQKQC